MTYRDKLHRKFKLSRDNTDWISYRNAKQSVKIALKKAEKEHVLGEVSAHKNNAALLWKIVNRSIPTKERPIQCYSQDPEYIANEFNQFFVAVSGKTANATVQVVLNNNLDVSILNSNPVTLREPT